MGTACTNCPRNTYLDTHGGRSEDACIECPQGTFTLGSGKTSDDACYSCPRGRHADRAAAGCIACERGRFTDSFAAASNYNCTQCPVNTYASEIGQRNCTACPTGGGGGGGSYSHRGHAQCIPCGLNATLHGRNGSRLTGYLQGWQPDDTLLWELDEESVAAGGSLHRQRSGNGPDGGATTTNDAVLNVTNCGGEGAGEGEGEGEGNSSSSSSSSSSCTTCARVSQDVSLGVENRMLFVFRAFARTRPHSVGSVENVTVTLRMGTRADLASPEALVQAFEFPTSATWAGKQASLYPAAVSGASLGGVARVTLSFCGAGSVEFARAGLFAAPTFACACEGATYVSAYDPDGGGTTTCTRCPAGSACSSGSIARCGSGAYSFGGATECDACRDGWRCHNGLSLPCGAVGKVKEAGESDANAECQRCPVGHRCNNGVAYGCPLGKWSPGGAHADQCLNCLPGTFANRTEAPNCTACAAGRTSNFGTWWCRDCQPGEYSPLGGSCQTCAAGSFSAVGSPNCTLCSPGTYSPGPGMWSCLGCKNGTIGSGGGGEYGATTAECDDGAAAARS
jgi:hypothetical protein